VNPADLKELYFILDRGSFVVYQEKDASWVGVIAFSSEEKAREFAAASKLEASEIAAVSTADADSLGRLINQVKRRAAKNLLLDLDWSTGRCVAVEFEGDRLGAAREWQFKPRSRK
jgi:hypothetical protein